MQKVRFFVTPRLRTCVPFIRRHLPGSVGKCTLLHALCKGNAGTNLVYRLPERRIVHAGIGIAAESINLCPQFYALLCFADTGDFTLQAVDFALIVCTLRGIKLFL